MLLDIANKAAGGELLSALQLIEQLRDRHLREARALLAGSHDAEDMAVEVGTTFDELAHLAEAFKTLGYLTPRSLDAVAAIGELLSSQIVAATFRARASLVAASFSCTAARTAPVAVVRSNAASSFASAIRAASLMFNWPMAHLW